MEIYRITKENSVLEVERRGAHLKSLMLDGKEIIMPSLDGEQTHGGAAFLIPYANRVRGGEYIWEGKKYVLPKNDGINSIHGLTRELYWTQSIDEEEIRMSTVLRNDGYPSVLKCSVSFRLASRSLRIGLSFNNTGETGVPLSVGVHPYFRFSEKWKLEATNGMSILNYVDDYFPDGTKSEVTPPILSSRDKKGYDNCYLVNGRIKYTTPNFSLDVRTERMNYFVIYNGKYSRGESVAIEPMTSPPDAFNNRISLIELNPGEEFSCASEFTLVE